MTSWVKQVPADALAEGVRYFIGKTNWVGCYMFVSRDIKGRGVWSVKPGIAVRFTAREAREFLAEHPDSVVIEIPKDADRRWKRRQKRLY